MDGGNRSDKREKRERQSTKYNAHDEKCGCGVH